MTGPIDGSPAIQVQLVRMAADGWTEMLRLGEFRQDLGAAVSLYGHGPGVESRATRAAGVISAAGAAPGGIRLEVQVAPSMESQLDREGTLYLDVLVSPGLREPSPEAVYRWVVEQVLLHGADRVEVRFGDDDTIARDVVVALGGRRYGIGGADE